MLIRHSSTSAAVGVQLAYTHTPTDPDFLYKDWPLFSYPRLLLIRANSDTTTDIAIWSTIEIGLAISATSLATLRPLVKQLGWKLGFASSQHLSRSRGPYANKIPSSNIHNKTNGNNRLDVYVLSEFSQARRSNKGGDDRDKLGTHTSAYAGKNMTRQSDKEADMDLDNKSQEQLHDPKSE